MLCERWLINIIPVHQLWAIVTDNYAVSVTHIHARRQPTYMVGTTPMILHLRSRLRNTVSSSRERKDIRPSELPPLRRRTYGANRAWLP